MKRRLPYLLLAIPSALSAVAYADNVDPHTYMGVRVGWAAYQDACGQNAQDCTDDATGYGVYAGYQFSPYLALEGGFTSYGTTEATYANGDVELNVYGGELSAKLSYPLTPNLEAFTRLGGTLQRLKKDGSGVPNAVNDSEWSTLAALGMSYRLSSRWALRGEYQFMDGIGNGKVGQADLHFTSIGLTYHFGQRTTENIAEPEAARQTFDTSEERVADAPMDEMSASVVSPEPVMALAWTQTLHFESGVTPNETELSALLERLQGVSPARLRIIGYSDSRGDEVMNKALSKRRAQVVADALQQHGLSDTKMVVVGMGENQPVASNDTAKGRAQNRRVDVIVDTLQTITEE